MTPDSLVKITLLPAFAQFCSPRCPSATSSPFLLLSVSLTLTLLQSHFSFLTYKFPICFGLGKQIIKLNKSWVGPKKTQVSDWLSAKSSQWGSGPNSGCLVDFLDWHPDTDQQTRLDMWFCPDSWLWEKALEALSTRCPQWVHFPPCTPSQGFISASLGFFPHCLRARGTGLASSCNSTLEKSNCKIVEESHR